LCIALHGKPIVELRSITCHMKSNTCHPQTCPTLTQARQAQAGIDLPTPEKFKAKLHLVLVIHPLHLDGLPVPVANSRSYKQQPLDSDTIVSQTHDLTIISPAPYHYATEPHAARSSLICSTSVSHREKNSRH